MPQGRKKLPFSTKQKKKQLQSKREQKQGENKSYGRQLLAYSNLLKDASEERRNSVNAHDDDAVGSSSNRYRLKFHSGKSKSSPSKNLENEALTETISVSSRYELELGICKKSERLGMPIRPPWSFKTNKQELDRQENKYFREYVDSVEKRDDFKKVGLFELNLETWRQLWRVLEMSDVILLITDIRHPVLNFPPALYKYVTQQLRKRIVLILNKVDLAPPSVAVAWKDYFKNQHPDLEVIFFCSLPRRVKNKTVDRNYESKKLMVKQNLRKLLQICQDLAGDNVDLSLWQKKIESDASDSFEKKEKINITMDPSEDSYRSPSNVKFRDGILTLGCIGYPNVGKSSLLNTLMGKKVVSVSRTPGHTKYFQTIFLTSTVKLCDCPGLVFPSYASKSLQVLSGSYPISQLRNPYGVIKYLAERLDLLQILKIQVKNDDNVTPSDAITTMDICEAWATKRGFYTAKAARPDIYRAANNLLRLALSGQICLCFYPPGYIDNEEMWKSHSDVVQFLHANDNDSGGFESENEDSQSDDSSDEGEPDTKSDVNIFSYLGCDH